LIEATFIKDDDDTDLEDEIKGYVEASTATTITVRGVTYTYDGVPAVSTDDFVEIHFDPITLTAPAGGVELEDDYFDQAEDLEVEIEGAVDLSTAGCPPEAEFKIDGVCIDSNSIPAEWMDGLTAFADLAQGSRAEAEGRMISNPTKDYLLADKVKGRGNRIRVSSIAGGVVAAAGTFELIEGNIDVTTMDGVTVFEDGLYIDDTMVPPQNILGQTVEVRGVSTGNPGEMLAIRIKLTGLSGGGDRHELRAEVDENGTDTVNNRLTVMGITTEANGSTELEDQDVEIAPGDGTTSNAQIDAFLGEIDADANAANGPRDVVEMGFDITTGDGTTTPYIADEWEIEDEDD
jgi:hypothetical protein